MKNFKNIVKYVRKFYFVLITALLIIIVFNSCSESGCTDPKALNYSSIAREDNGTCIYCNTKTEQVDSRTALLGDYNFSSPHYNQIVADFKVLQDSSFYNDETCGISICYLSLNIQNKIGQEMEFTFSLVGNANGISFSRHIILGSNDTIVFDTIPNVTLPCNKLNSGVLYATSLGPIVYH